MAYFVTGGTGFIGRFLVDELVAGREGTIYLLTRRERKARAEALVRRWGADRVVPVTGDITRRGLGVDRGWVAEHSGEIDHFFHLAAVYDLAATAEVNRKSNVDGTRRALQLAGGLGAGRFHYMSSVAVSGDHRGPYDESMFDVGQEHSASYTETKAEAEALVRESGLAWRVYRPSIVVGHSETGEMDKVDGPYYLFPLLRVLRDLVPGWVPLVGVDLGDTNVVPVDYVAKATDHLAHRPDLDGQTFHLTNPEPQPVTEVINLFCAAAGAPRFATPVDRHVARRLPFAGLVPDALKPSRIASAVVRSLPGQALLEQTVGRLGVPAEVISHTAFPAVYDARRTERALAGSGLSVPDLESYARTLWDYWECFLDESTGRDPEVRDTLHGRHVVITGASSGIGHVTALKVAQAGGVPILVARGKDKLEETRETIEQRGGQAYVYPCDLSDLVAIDDLCARLSADFTAIDFLVNNAGRSIRRSLANSHDRFHDFERTMQLNYFGAIRLVMGLLDKMKAQGGAHVVNISSIGVQANPPRFSAYVASKSALDAWSNVVAAELVGDGITFTSVHMPLVRTPMTAPTTLYDKFPLLSAAQAADVVIKALVDRPTAINTALGNLGAVAHTVAPKLAFRVLNLAFQVFPDSEAARGSDPSRESEQMMLAKVFKGVHW